MPRKPEFVRLNVLNAAMEVFWTRGYEASSVTRLVEAMQLNRGSLYGAFGDKENLFLEVIQNYAGVVQEILTETLVEIEDPIVAIKMFFQRALLDDEAAAAKGCLLFNTITELNNTNPEIALEAVKIIDSIRVLMERRLQEAKDRQLIAEHKNVKTLSQFLIALMAGLRVQCKSGLGREEIKKILDVGLQTLQNP